MKTLVTAGSTQVPIDQVRAISNIFKGQTGWNIAEYFCMEGPRPWKPLDVTLLTSNAFRDNAPWITKKYRTFDDLATSLEKEVVNNNYDVIIHSAAISDYQVSRVLDENLQALDKSKKISSQHSKMYLELSQTPKLVDRFRDPWGFKGILVKFKLQVGISDLELIEIAKASRIASQADLIVANCLEWSQERAYIIGSNFITSVTRKELPAKLYQIITLLRENT